MCVCIFCNIINSSWFSFPKTLGLSLYVLYSWFIDHKSSCRCLEPKNPRQWYLKGLTFVETMNWKALLEFFYCCWKMSKDVFLKSWKVKKKSVFLCLLSSGGTWWKVKPFRRSIPREALWRKSTFPRTFPPSSPSTTSASSTSCRGWREDGAAPKDEPETNYYCFQTSAKSCILKGQVCILSQTLAIVLSLNTLKVLWGHVPSIIWA